MLRLFDAKIPVTECTIPGLSGHESVRMWSCAILVEMGEDGDFAFASEGEKGLGLLRRDENPARLILHPETPKDGVVVVMQDERTRSLQAGMERLAAAAAAAVAAALRTRTICLSLVDGCRWRSSCACEAALVLDLNPCLMEYSDSTFLRPCRWLSLSIRA